MQFDKAAYRIGIAATLALGLSGCAGSRSGGIADTFGNMFSSGSAAATPVPTGPDEHNVDCPQIEIIEGQNAYRAYAGSDRSSDGVRYQYSFGDMSRECHSVDNTISIRVGVSGYVLAGPAGASGSFTVPVKIAIRREKDQQMLETKVYRIPATMPPGQTQAPFSLVTDPMTVPYLGDAADGDYSILVGFDQGGAATKPAKAARHRRKR
jgi:hypothetical protein